MVGAENFVRRSQRLAARREAFRRENPRQAEAEEERVQFIENRLRMRRNRNERKRRILNSLRAADERRRGNNGELARRMEEAERKSKAWHIQAYKQLVVLHVENNQLERRLEELEAQIEQTKRHNQTYWARVQCRVTWKEEKLEEAENSGTK